MEAEKKTYTYDEKFAQNTLLAELITKSYKLDLDCMEQQYRELDTQLTVMPIMDPTAWRRTINPLKQLWLWSRRVSNSLRLLGL
jgi:hypothetical protein